VADQIRTTKKQSTLEIRQWDFDFSLEVVGGASIASATAEHVPPSGAAATPTVGNIVANVVPVRIGPLSAVGIHKLGCLATHSDGAKTELSVIFEVVDLP
jgi:hypothetical protein